jgi:peptide/nickel transport system substrate-binding protein
MTMLRRISSRAPGRVGPGRRGAAVVAMAGALALALSACTSATSVDQVPSSTSSDQPSTPAGASSSADAGGSTSPAPSGNTTLTIDSSFIVTSMDPSRAVTPTQSVATRAMYDTLLRTHGEDTTPQPSVAKSFDASDDAKTYTFHLRDDVTFADGSKLTSADVLFSFQRLAALKLGGSYLMDGLTVSAPDPQTVVLTSKDPKPAIPIIVTTPAFAILNSAMVKEAGGTDAADAPDKDKADTWFNSHSAGSGPYVLQSYKTDDSITLVRNDKYWGEDKGEFDRVVIRNMTAATQLLNVQRGNNEIALDLSATQSATLKGKDNVTVKTDPSSSVFRVQMNMDPEASKVASNPHIQAAVRYGINYDAIVQLGGDGAVQAAGIVPSTLPGSLPESEAIHQDVDKAKAELAASGVDKPSLTMTYPSDINVNGLEFATLAQRVAADLQAIGFTIKLEAQPVATYLPEWVKGKTEMTLTYNYPDYMDSSYYSSFVPGTSSDSQRAGWNKDVPELSSLRDEINSTVDDAKRAELMQDLQRKFNENSPYIPLMQTAQTVVSTSNLTGVVLDPSWILDVAAIGTK